MKNELIKLFLRLAISFGFLSAVADRFGIWSKEVSVWGNWENFLSYTKLINPWFPDSIVPVIGAVATAAEIIFAIFLIIGFKTELFAKLSGFLLLICAGHAGRGRQHAVQHGAAGARQTRDHRRDLHIAERTAQRKHHPPIDVAAHRDRPPQAMQHDSHGNRRVAEDDLRSNQRREGAGNALTIGLVANRAGRVDRASD